MKIPDTTKSARFYVAISDEEALSSWGSLQDARASIKRMRQEAKKNAGLKDELKRITRIIETGPTVDDRQEHPIRPEKGGMPKKIREVLISATGIDPSDDEWKEEEGFKLRTWHPERLKTMGTICGVTKNECFDDEVIDAFRKWGIDKVHVLFVPGGDRWYVASMAVESNNVSRGEQIERLVNLKHGSLCVSGSGPIIWTSG